MKQWLKETLANSSVVFAVVALTAVPVVLLLFHVWHQFRIADVGYEIAEATAEHQELLEENKKLTVEVRLQGRSDRVAEMARDRFGLEEAGPEQIVTIDESFESSPEEHARLESSDEPGPVVR